MSSSTTEPDVPESAAAGAETPKQDAEVSPSSGDQAEAAKKTPEDAPEVAPAARDETPTPPKAQDPLRRAAMVKVATYARGLSAGLGIKVTSPKALAALLTKPDGKTVVTAALTEKVNAALGDANVTYGVDGDAITDAVETTLSDATKGVFEVVSRKIAQGEAPESGEDGCLEYPLNPFNKPMHVVLNVDPKANQAWFRMVQKGDVLVRVVPPKEGTPGQSVTGERIDPNPVRSAPALSSVAGVNTVVDKDVIRSDGDGACEEVASGQVRVVPEFAIDSVDSSTGNIPSAGVSKASLMVCRDVQSRYSVSSAENVFVGLGKSGGVVEKETHITAKNVVVNGQVMGEPQMAGSPPAKAGELQVSGTCLLKEADGAIASAARILVEGDCRRSHLDADERVGIGGSLLAGVTLCRKTLSIGGDLGSEEGGSSTLILIPAGDTASRASKQRAIVGSRLQKQLEAAQLELDELEKTTTKRSTVDTYWAALVAEEVRSPKKPIEARTLKQYQEMIDVKKGLERQISAANKAIAQLKQADEEEEAGGEEAVAIQIGGHLFLDARIQTAETAAEEDLEEEVSYDEDGKRCEGRKLQDLLGLLSKQAAEYVQSRSEAIDERKQAVEKMFEGRENRPTGPQIEHKSFEHPFAWGSSNPENKGLLRIQYLAVVDTSQPRELKIVSSAVGRDVVEGLEIAVSREGPKVSFTAEKTGSRVIDWRKDPEITAPLDQIVMKGLTAREFIAGAKLAEEEVSSGAGKVAEDAAEDAAGESAEGDGGETGDAAEDRKGS